MKRAAPEEEPVELSDDSVSSDSDDEAGNGKGENFFRLPKSSKSAAQAEALSKKKKPGGVDFSALSRHGYRGGPSVLTVAPPKVDPNWTWSTGKDRNEKEVLAESFEERERTRAAVTEGEKLIGVRNPQPRQTEKEKEASFSQKEKKKRDRGQASRGKNYVEEEKRLLRGSGVYSGFDT